MKYQTFHLASQSLSEILDWYANNELLLVSKEVLIDSGYQKLKLAYLVESDSTMNALVNQVNSFLN